MGNFEKNISIEYLRNSANQMMQLKELSYQLLDLSEPKKIVDIGCGPGIDTVAMAKLSHEESHIIGVDFDQAMIDTANEYAKQEMVDSKVRHIKASAIELPFSEENFDAVRAERLFQVIPSTIASSQVIFNELYRVLSLNGIMVLADTDWATVSINFSDIEIERRFVRFFCDVCRPNGYAGRQFLELMNKAGMIDIEVFVVPIIMRQFNSQFPLADWLVRELKSHNKATDTEIDNWMTELTEKSEKGEFLAVANMNIVKGVKK